MGQEGCRSEAGFEFGKGRSCRGKVEWKTGGNDRGEAVHGEGEESVVVNVSTVRICETQEFLDFLDRCRFGPVKNCGCSRWVHVKSLGSDDVAKERR